MAKTLAIFTSSYSGNQLWRPHKVVLILDWSDWLTSKIENDYRYRMMHLVLANEYRYRQKIQKEFPKVFYAINLNITLVSSDTLNSFGRKSMMLPVPLVSCTAERRNRVYSASRFESIVYVNEITSEVPHRWDKVYSYCYHKIPSWNKVSEYCSHVDIYKLKFPGLQEVDVKYQSSMKHDSLLSVNVNRK